MAFQPTTFPLIPYHQLPTYTPDYSSLKDLFPNMVKAYNQPIQLKQEREGRESENREKRINAYLKEKYGEPKAEAEIGLTKAQTQSQLAHAQHSRALAGNVGKIAPTELSKIVNERNQIANDIEKNSANLNPFELQQKQDALSTYDSYLKGKTTSSANNRLTQWKSLPPEERNFMIAKGREGWGANADQILSEYLEGKSLEDMAAARGVDLSKIGGHFAPTKANITQQKNVEGAAAELEYLEGLATEWMTPYASTLMGYSPSQIKDAISGENEDEQAKFLASRAMQLELAGTRSRITAGSSAHEALKDMQKDALGQIKIFRDLVSSSVYAKSQKYLSDALREGVKIRGQAISNLDKETKALKETNPKNNSNVGGVEAKIGSPFNTNGGVNIEYKGTIYYNVPPERAQQFLTKGGVIKNGK